MSSSQFDNGGAKRSTRAVEFVFESLEHEKKNTIRRKLPSRHACLARYHLNQGHRHLWRLFKSLAAKEKVFIGAAATRVNVCLGFELPVKNMRV